MSILLRVYSKETCHQIPQELKHWSTVWSTPICNLEVFETEIGIYSIKFTNKKAIEAFDSQKQLLLYTIGTVFQEKVWKILLSIPFGQIWTYKDVAHKTDSPNSYRAVGSALRKNPFPFLIPCHRVIRSNGDLGGFLGGAEFKQKLLDWEKNHPELIV